MAYIDEKDIYKLFENGCGIERLHVVQIDELPRVDAVEVVRCNDCKYWQEDGYDTLLKRKYGKCYMPFGEYGVVCDLSENDFCSYGKRKVKQDEEC